MWTNICMWRIPQLVWTEEQNALSFRCLVIQSPGAAPSPPHVWVMVCCCQAAHFASSCQPSHSGSPHTALLGSLHLLLLIANRVLVVICRQLALLHKTQNSGCRKMIFMVTEKKTECILKVKKLESKTSIFFFQIIVSTTKDVFFWIFKWFIVLGLCISVSDFGLCPFIPSY